MSRKPIPFRRPKDEEIASLQQEIKAKADRLAKLATPYAFTFYWRNLTTHMRNQGVILPGDGKGGLLPPKEPKP